MQIFIDTNILLCALVKPLTPAGSLIALASLRQPPYRIVLAEFVRLEAEAHLASRSPALLPMLNAMVKLIRPLHVRLPTAAEIAHVSGWIRHVHDTPVVASALLATYDVLVSDNNKDFDASLARRLGKPVCTAKIFISRMTMQPFP